MNRILNGLAGLLGIPRLAAIGVSLAVVAVLGVGAWLHHAGVKAGAAGVTQQAEAAHTGAVAQARGDERAAANASTTIATSTAQQTVAAAAVTHYIIEDLHNAINAVPPAAPGAALPAAPVDSLRASLNTAVAGANRAADAADAVP